MRAIILAGALLALGGPAWAEPAAAPAPTSSSYLGAGVSHNSYKDWSDLSLNVDGSFTSESTDDSGTGFRLFGGFALSEVFALEIGYQDLGEVTYDGESNGCCFFPAGHYSATGTATGFDLGVRARAAFTPTTAALLRIGSLFWQAEVDVDTPVGSDTESTDGNDLLVGFGLQYDGWDAAGVRLEYVRYELDDEHVDSLAASLVLRLK